VEYGEPQYTEYTPATEYTVVTEYTEPSTATEYTPATEYTVATEYTEPAEYPPGYDPTAAVYSDTGLPVTPPSDRLPGDPSGW
jgi:hypothetical protein